MQPGSKKLDKIAQFPYTVEQWKSSDAHSLYRLEKSCWAPWLQKSESDFLTIATKYPKIQRLIRNRIGSVVAAMSVNKINWNGKLETLPSWDTIAGGGIGTSNFTTTYTSDGNTLCLMSMNVNSNLQGIGLAQKLIEELKNTANTLGAEHIISSLRPLDFGEYKLKLLREEKQTISFNDYCNLKNDKGEPYDRWLRSAHHQGMRILSVSKNAIVVHVSRKKFDSFVQTYHPLKWIQTSDNSWECGETGTWHVDNNSATYREDNLAVEIPLNNTK